MSDRTYLKFHDEDGDPVYVLNDILAIYTEVDKTEIQSFMGVEATTVTGTPVRVVISKSSGKWEVIESYEEILDKIKAATECE